MEDEKDMVIAHLRAELARHKQMLSGVYAQKNRWLKEKADYGARLSLFHNENQKLKATIRKLENPAPEPCGVAIPVRRRWKGIKFGSSGERAH